MSGVAAVQPSSATRPSRTSTATTRPSPKRGAACGEEVGARRGGADEHARGAGGERGLDRLERAVAAADLHGHTARGGDDALEQARRRRAREGAVEVDEVEERRALGDEAPRGLHRIAALDVTRSRSPWASRTQRPSSTSRAGATTKWFALL